MLSYEEMLMMDRPKSGHMHMDVRNRAKQFAPFDALRGFGASIREKTVIYSDPPALCEDRKEELEITLSGVKSGDRVSVLYFKESPKVRPKGRYETIEGRVEIVEYGGILLVEAAEIPVKDIVDLRRL